MCGRCSQLSVTSFARNHRINAKFVLIIRTFWPAALLTCVYRKLADSAFACSWEMTCQRIKR